MDFEHPSADEVDQLLLNARLRDELEPYLDESFDLFDQRRMPTQVENEFLASMLAWERAATLPISRWMEPELVLPHPDRLDEGQLHALLWDAIERLFAHRIVLEFTDHLNDRQLYCLICRDILPAEEKKIDLPKNYLRWHCIDFDDDAELWLKYYASRDEREAWSGENNLPLPLSLAPPFPRKMPRRPQ